MEVEFIAEAFWELEKARLLLGWSYAYDLLQLGGSDAKQTVTTARKQFISHQFELEKCVELLSSFISYNRLRNSKSMVMEATMQVRWKRLKLEHAIQQCSDIVTTSPKAALHSPSKQDVFINQRHRTSEFDSVWQGKKVTGIAIDPSVSSESEGREEPDNVSILSGHTEVEEPLVILPKKDPDEEALEHALLLSEQQDKFGCTMYEVLTPGDERLVRDYIDAGFTKEESTLLVFEEKFGEVPKTIPSMPTLSAERLNDRSGRALSSQEVDEIEALMKKGYSLEQARTAVLHSADGLSGSSNDRVMDSSSDLFSPHPREQEFNLTDREALAVEHVMQARNCARKDAVDVVVAERLRRQEAALVPFNQMRTPTTNREVEYRVRNLMMQGFTEPQARVLVQPPIAPYHSVASSRMDASLHPSEVQALMNRGYSRDQAMVMLRNQGGRSASNSETTVQRLISQGYSLNQAMQISRRNQLTTSTGSNYQLTQPLQTIRRDVDLQARFSNDSTMAQTTQIVEQRQESQTNFTNRTVTNAIIE